MEGIVMSDASLATDGSAEPPTPPVRDAYWRRARVVRVIDGDTLVLIIDLGFRMYAEQMVRLLEINTPELRSGPPAERERGAAAREFTLAWLQDHAGHGPADWPLSIRTEKGDSFGRWLAYVECGAGHRLHEALLAAGLAVAYR
jgi:endonuclease YncB( thermonuclease family)